jgi:hypothetical protein
MTTLENGRNPYNPFLASDMVINDIIVIFMIRTRVLIDIVEQYLNVDSITNSVIF